VRNKRKSNEEKTGKALGKEEESSPEWGVKTPNLGAQAGGGGGIVTSSTPEIQRPTELGCRPRNQFPSFREKALKYIYIYRYKYSISILLLFLFFSLF
jgi:hypothetical protein